MNTDCSQRLWLDRGKGDGRWNEIVVYEKDSAIAEDVDVIQSNMMFARRRRFVLVHSLHGYSSIRKLQSLSLEVVREYPMRP